MTITKELPVGWPVADNGSLTAWSCFYCAGEHQAGCGHLTIDHVVPQSKGGRGLGRDNLVAACRSCNSSKCARIFPDEWVPDIDENTIVLPGRWTWPATPRSAGLVALGLRELLDGASAPFSVAEIASMTADEPRTVQKALARLQHVGAMVFRANAAAPWRRFYEPA